MSKRPYFSVRTGRHDGAVQFDLSMLQKLLRNLFLGFSERCYFQEAFGYHCVDDGQVPGLLGTDIAAQLFLPLRKPDLWPIDERISSYCDDDCFDVVEFLYDHVTCSRLCRRRGAAAQFRHPDGYGREHRHYHHEYPGLLRIRRP